MKEHKTTSYTYTIKKALFLEFLSKTCNVKYSCKLAGVDRSDMYKLRKRNKEFAIAWEKARQEGILALEDEAYRRAREGAIRINEYGEYKIYSDSLMIFLLKALRPQKYKFWKRFERKLPSISEMPNLDEVLNKVMRKK